MLRGIVRAGIGAVLRGSERWWLGLLLGTPPELCRRLRVCYFAEASGMGVVIGGWASLVERDSLTVPAELGCVPLRTHVCRVDLGYRQRRRSARSMGTFRRER